MCSKLIITGLIFIQFLMTVACVRITKLSVPSSYVIGMNYCRPLILDCDYEFRISDIGFVLKWYHNNHLIFQWIPPKKPHVFYHINTSFISSIEEKYKYKSILLRPHYNLTGDWMCSVQTYRTRDRKIKKMQVIVPEKSFALYQRNVSYFNGFIVFCTVIHIYPEPELSISINGNVNVISEMKSESDGNGFFNKSIMARIDKYFIQSPSLINCMLEINETDYIKKKKIIYYDYKYDKNHPNAINTHMSKFKSASNLNKISIVCLILIFAINFLILIKN